MPVGVLRKAPLRLASSGQRLALTALALFASFGIPVAFGDIPSDPANRLQLTEEEQRWIEAHPVINIAATADWPPFEFVDGEGNYRGISADILRHIAQSAGFQIEPVTGVWSELYPRLLNKELDLSPGMQASPQRQAHFKFSRPILNFPHAIYHLRDRRDLHGFESLAGKRVSVELDYYEHEFLREHHPDIELLPVENALQALLKVASGEADAYVGNVAVAAYIIDKNVLTNIQMGPYVDMGRLELSMGVRDDYGPLVSILDKGIAALSPDERRSIIARYTLAPQMVVLSDAEYAWIRENPIIRLGIDPEFAPFEYVDEQGAYRGLASDYVRLLNERLGLSMEVVHNTSWDEAVEKMAQGELDVLPCLGVSEARREFMDFTEPYLAFHRVIITRLDTPFAGSLDDLAGQPIGVQQDSSHHAYLLANTATPPVTFDSFNDTLLAVARGEVDWAVGNAATATYWMKRIGLTNLRLAVPLGGELETLHFGIRKDWPELLSILNKGLASITEEEANAIRRKWMDVEVSGGLDMARIWRIVGILLAIVVPLILLLSLHNRRLQKEIHSREVLATSLRESELEYRTLVESANSVILRMMPDGRVTFLNTFGERFLGFSEDELLDKSIVGTIIPNTEAAIQNMAELRQDLETKKEKYRVEETENFTRTGKPVRIAWTYRGLFSDDGKLLEVLCVGNDVTAQWEASEILRRYEFIVNTVREMMSIINRFGCYEAVNDEWCAATGLARESVLGRTVASVWPEETVAESILPRLERCFAGETVSYDAHILLPERGERICHVIMYPFTNNQTRSTTHAIVVAQDITERKETELKLQRAMAAAEAGTRAKSAFLANMSHEIRTPLNAVLGYTQLLQRLPGLSRDQAHALNAIRNSGDHLLTLISDILELSRIEAGHVALSYSRFNVRNLLADIQTMFQVKSDAKGLHLEMETMEDVPENIKSDRNRVSQVLINLLGNAHKFTERGGIKVRTQSEALPEQESVRITINVEDTGCGIASEDIHAIFGAFEQSGDQDMRHGGTGLGLAISRNFAQLLGGDLTVASTPGEGSCFRFSFVATPCAEDEMEPKRNLRTVRRLRPDQEEQRVLVVDDRESNRDLLCRMLNMLGFVTQEAQNGLEALEAFEAWQPQIILIDLIMPVMGGREAIRRIRALPAGKAVAIIVLTASTMGDDKDDILADGANAFLRKPFREEELLDAIHAFGHVDFEYDDETDEAPRKAPMTEAEAREAMEALPEDLKNRLQSVIMRGAIGEARALARNVAEHNTMLAELIEERSCDYRLNELQSLWSEAETP